MKRFTEAGITLEPRTVSLCIDMAFRFVGQEWRAVLGCLLGCAIPAAVLIDAGARWTPVGWLIALIVTAIATVVLGNLLVTHAASVAFREPLSYRRFFQLALWQSLSMIVTKSLMRLVVLLMFPLVIPAVMLLVYGRFNTESHILRAFRRSEHEHRARDLVQKEFSDLVLRMSQLLAFGCLFGIVTMLTCDALCKLLLDFSPFFGTLQEAARSPWGYYDPLDIIEELWTALIGDSRILILMSFSTLATYAVLRLAWFFTYVDLRIRRDCWDLEVALADETQRWERPA